MGSAATTNTTPKNLIPTIRLQKDIDDLFAKRKSLTRSGNQTTTLSSIYYQRPLPEESEPILFLLHAPKKFVKPAHERNTLKRWMREAIRKNNELKTIRELLLEKKLQVLLLFRSDFKPSKDHAWNQIEADVSVVMKRLMKNLHNS